MKKYLASIVCILAFAVGLHASETVKEADNMKIRISMEHDPPVAGENNLLIMLTDSEGKSVSKAKIKISYAMPPMGNMPPMSYKARAKHDGEGYRAKVNLPMSGKWGFDINIMKPDKSLTKTAFSVVVP
jgi:hypothetical protein